MTTREKIETLVGELRTMKLDQCDPDTRPIVEMLQIIEGIGFDPLGMLLPHSDADADKQIDALLTLLFQVRGDDLPPYDFDRHVREATAMETGEVIELDPAHVRELNPGDE